MTTPCDKAQEIEDLSITLVRITERIDFGFKNIGERLTEISKSQHDTDLIQFDEIGKNRVTIGKVEERLEGVQGEIKDINKKLSNGGIRATAVVKPDKSLGLIDTIKSIRMIWLIIIFCGGGASTLILLEKIINVLQHIKDSLSLAFFGG